MVAAKRRRVVAFVFSALSLLFGSIVFAQDQLSLIADRIVISPNGDTITAEGRVTVTYQGNTLTTDLIIYDRQSGQITFPQPTQFETEDGAVISAREAQLRDDLIAGRFKEVELRLSEQFVVLADELDRIDEDRTVLTTGIATTCRICDKSDTPFWQIRAKSVEHRADEQRLYFEGAVFEFLGIPVFYAPRLRTPDPTVERASGLLVPRFRTSNTLGFGIEVPYYFVIGDHADVTLTPFATTEGAFVIGGEYRQLFENGALFSEGAVALEDPLSDEDFRSFGTVKGVFDLKHDYEISFQANAASDRSFRREYGFGDEDRLENFAAITRPQASSFFDARASTTQSLREGEDTSEIPLVLPEVYYTNITNFGKGWRLRNEYQTVTLFRENARRTGRLGFRTTASKNYVTQAGLAFDVQGRLEASTYIVDGDNQFDDGTYSYVHPTLATTLRYPLAKRHINGGTSLIEPIAQLVLSPDQNISVPNEDSVQLEFEENNLFSLNRFPGFDALEVGTRANLGVRYLYTAPGDWRFGLSMGQVFRIDEPTEFENVSATGLSAKSSDTVIAVTFDIAESLSISNRALVGRDFEVSKFEAQLDYRASNWTATIDYIFLEEDVLALAGTQDQIDVAFTYAASSNWTLKTELRHDFEQREAIEQFLGATYRNECIALDFGLTLDYATGSENEAEQEFGVGIELLGFGGNRTNNGRGAKC